MIQRETTRGHELASLLALLLFFGCGVGVADGVESQSQALAAAAGASGEVVARHGARAHEVEPAAVEADDVIVVDGVLMKIVDPRGSAREAGTAVALLQQNCKCISPECESYLCPLPTDAFVAPSRSPRPCGGQAGKTCGPREYCAYDGGIALCGAADATAVCLPRPSACNLSYEPVCGCDGKTYPNACAAARDGTGVLYDGPCSPPGTTFELATQQAQPSASWPWSCETPASCDIDDLKSRSCIPNCVCVWPEGCPCCDYLVPGTDTPAIADDFVAVEGTSEFDGCCTDCSDPAHCENCHEESFLEGIFGCVPGSVSANCPITSGGTYNCSYDD
jgi:hypothetical protein